MKAHADVKKEIRYRHDCGTVENGIVRLYRAAENGKTAKDLAQKKGCANIVELLQRYEDGLDGQGAEIEAEVE